MSSVRRRLNAMSGYSRVVGVLVVAVILAACQSTDTNPGGVDTSTTVAGTTTPVAPYPDDEDVPVDIAGLHAAALDYALSQGQARGKNLVYVTGPSLDPWDLYCGARFVDNPGIDDACDVLGSIAFDLPPVFEGDTAAEIIDALDPANVEFAENPDELREPLQDGMMTAPVINDAGLFSFGVSIEVSGKVYIPLDGLGEGWLFEATPTDEGWNIEPVGFWVV